jgi:hypothetical protein
LPLSVNYLDKGQLGTSGDGFAEPTSAMRCVGIAALDRNARSVRMTIYAREGISPERLRFRTEIAALAVPYETTHAHLAIGHHAELFDEFQLGLQKIDVLFFID